MVQINTNYMYGNFKYYLVSNPIQFWSDPIHIE
jgi:hypothetical protein